MTPTSAPQEIEDRLRGLPASLVIGADDTRMLAALSGWRPAEVGRLHRPRRFRLQPALGALAAFALVAVVLNIAAVYFAPTYGRALADAPGIGTVSNSMLKFYGLSVGDVTVIGDTATSNGHTVRLVAGYADALRTVLFFTIDGRGMTDDTKGFGRNAGDYAPTDLILTDQFGHGYDENLVSAVPEYSFQPLAWPASKVGARLTIHISGLTPMWMTPFGPELKGSWTLHAVLVPGDPYRVSLPPPLVVPSATYTFTSARASGRTMQIHFAVSGPVIGEVADQWRKWSQPGQAPQAYTELMQQYFWIQMFDESGKPVLMDEWGFGFPKDWTGPAKGDITAFIPGPGRYRIQFGSALSAPEDARWILVT